MKILVDKDWESSTLWVPGADGGWASCDLGYFEPPKEIIERLNYLSDWFKIYLPCSNAPESGMKRLVLVLFLFVLNLANAQEPIRPPTGVEVDEARNIPMRAEQKAPCLYVEEGKYVIILDQSEVEQRANVKQGTWKTEEERMALIHGRRAQEILRSVSKGAEYSHCSFADIPQFGEARLFILRQLERGEATVMERSTGRVIPSIVVRYVGRNTNAFGDGKIFVSAPGDENPFLRMMWWIR